MKQSNAEAAIEACRDLWDSVPADLGLCPWDDAIEKLARLPKIMIGASRNRSLIAASQRNEPAIWEHIFDSLQALFLLDPGNDVHLADAGSGNGFPGLPLAIALPGAKLSLIERSARKADFLAYAIALLSLANTKVFPLDLAEFDWKAQQVDVLLIRALATPGECGVLLENSGALNSSLIAYATEQTSVEWTAQSKRLGLRVTAARDYRLPGRKAERRILKISRS